MLLIALCKHTKQKPTFCIQVPPLQPDLIWSLYAQSFIPLKNSSLTEELVSSIVMCNSLQITSHVCQAINTNIGHKRQHQWFIYSVAKWTTTY